MNEFLKEVLLDNANTLPTRYYSSIASDSNKGVETVIDEVEVNKDINRVSEIIKDEVLPSLPASSLFRYLYKYPELFHLFRNYITIPEILRELPQFIFYQTKYPEIKEFLSPAMIFPEDETNINYLTTQLIEKEHSQYLMEYWANHPSMIHPTDEICEITKAPWKVTNPALREAITQFYIITYSSSRDTTVLFEFIKKYMTPGDILTLCLNSITTEYYDELCSLIPTMLNIQKFFPKDPHFPSYRGRSLLLIFKEHLIKTMTNAQLIDTINTL